MDALQNASSTSPFLPGLKVGILISIFLSAIFFEWLHPLRNETQSKTKRTLINLGLASTSAVVLRFTFYPFVMALAFWVERNGYGLLNWLKISALPATIASLLLLDWTLYYWHWLLHKMPFLWRFHNVHHADLDLDSSTALRFHFGELMISCFYRSAQILIFGISPFNLALFELMVTSFAQFHHANIRLPLRIEGLIGKFLITPRLHTVHHSTVRSETDSNFGTVLTIWDVIHRTLQAKVPQDRIVIGVPLYRDPKELGLGSVLRLPFRRQRPWIDKNVRNE